MLDAESPSPPTGLGLDLPREQNPGIPPSESASVGRRPATDRSDTPPPLSPPSLGSPISLLRFGISPLSPLRRQFSSSHSQHSAQSSSLDTGRGSGPDELSQDNKDVLVQRLGDLIKRLDVGDGMSDETVSRLHAKVDEIERHIATDASRRVRRTPPNLHFVGVHNHGDTAYDERSLWSAPSPSWFRSRFSNTSAPGSVPPSPQPQQGESPSHSHPLLGQEQKKPSMTVGEAKRITDEAEELNTKLASLLETLKARHEESSHIYALLINRAERAAQEILVLQEKVHQLEAELQETDSELSHLRLGLKAIEVQCPPDVDDDLRQSIDNWKSDWAKLKKQRAARGGRLAASPGTPQTPTPRPVIS